MLQGETPTIYGDGEQSRDFTFIQNVVRGNFLAAEAPANAVVGTVLNLATGSRITLNETVKLLRELTGYQGEVKHGPERTGDITHSFADIRLAQTQLGYAPQVDFNEGLRRTVQWYKATTKLEVAESQVVVDTRNATKGIQAVKITRC